VGRNIVEIQASRETHAGNDGVAVSQTIVSDQEANAILNPIGNLSERLARFDASLGCLADLAMHLCSLAVVGQEIAVDVIETPLLFAGSAVSIVICVFDLFALGIAVVWE
jgi:hypothetical protein